MKPLNKEACAMVTAIILMNVEHKCIGEVADALHRLEGVTEVYSVAGQYDLVAVLRTESNEKIAELVTGSLLKIDGIINTETLIAFASYSRFNLERLFSIGAE